MASFQSKLNDDVQQCVLQFLSNDKSVKAVCKSFKRHIEQNQIRDVRSFKETLSREQAHFEGSTWIVDPNRDTLTNKEIQNGFKGPCTSLVEAMGMMESGDKVLLCEGDHEWYPEDENEHTIFQEDQCLYIEGIGECFLSFHAEHESAFYGKLHLRNLHIREDKSRGYLLLEVRNKGSISLTDCVVDGALLHCYDESSLVCNQCVFTDNMSEFRICGENRSSLSLVGCKFQMNRIPETVVPSDMWDSYWEEVSIFEATGGQVTVRLMGCVFSSQNILLNPLTKIQQGIDTKTSTFQYNKFIQHHMV